MNNLSFYDELDQAIDQIIAHPEATPTSTQPTVSELLDIASDLRHLPRPDFKMRLRVELQWQAMGNKVIKDQDVVSAGKPRLVETDILPTLFGKGYGTYPVRCSNFAFSLAAHAVAVLVIGAMGLLVVNHGAVQRVSSENATMLTPYVPPVAAKTAGGGGGGGDASKLPASHGSLPQLAHQQMIIPPVVIMQNRQPKLAVTPTIVADLKVPQTSQVGDPLSSVISASPSNGPGVRSGIGSGDGGGVGSGSGGGVGAGKDVGFGGGVYRVGNGVTAPRVIYSPDPDYSDEARKAKYQGVVTLWAIITPDGRPVNIRVARSLGMGLDEKAVETVRHWRFEPGKKDGVPVPVVINVEVDFHLY